MQELTWTEVSKMRVDEFAINERGRRLGQNEMAPGDGTGRLTSMRRRMHSRQLVGARATIPEDQWDNMLDSYGVPTQHRQRLYKDLVDALLTGAHEVVGAYASHARTLVTEG
eukprot:3938910-Rhodomonas_salina.5